MTTAPLAPDRMITEPPAHGEKVLEAEALTVAAPPAEAGPQINPAAPGPTAGSHNQITLMYYNSPELITILDLGTRIDEPTAKAMHLSQCTWHLTSWHLLPKGVLTQNDFTTFCFSLWPHKAGHVQSFCS